MIRQSKQFAAIYCRIDNGGNADMLMAEAIRHQELQATEYAHQNNLMLMQIFFDTCFSGNTIKRPVFQEMLLSLRKGVDGNASSVYGI